MNWMNARWFGFQPLMVLPTVFLGFVAAAHALGRDWGPMVVMGLGSAIGVYVCFGHRGAPTPV